MKKFAIKPPENEIEKEVDYYIKQKKPRKLNLKI